MSDEDELELFPTYLVQSSMLNCVDIRGLFSEIKRTDGTRKYTFTHSYALMSRTSWEENILCHRTDIDFRYSLNYVEI